MRKILIITEKFAPQNYIAAIRPTKFGKYLNMDYDYCVYAISKADCQKLVDPILEKDLDHITKLITLGKENLEERQSSKFTDSEKILNKQKHILNKIIHILSNYFRGKSFARKIITEIKKTNMEYDAVFMTAGITINAIVGKYLKKSRRCKFIILDLRDPAYTVRNNFFIKLIGKYYIKKGLKYSDFFTGVAKECILEFAKNSRSKTAVLINGFDREDLRGIEICKEKSKFTFTYTGGLYRGRRDLSICFKAIKELIDEKKIEKDNILINYAGSSETDFIEQLSKNKLMESGKTYGIIEREKSLELQINSDVLLLASWNSIGETGVITGKFLEYMMINKPIVCIITGNLANSQLKDMIKEANNGVVWEEANKEEDYDKLKRYILMQYQQFEKGKPLIFEPNKEYIEQFDYKNLTKKLVDLIEEGLDAK